MTWVINTNTNSCQIYYYQKNPPTLTLLKELSHPENKLKASESLTSDKPGRYQTDSAAHGTYTPHSDPKSVQIDNFSREIANELNLGRNTRAYEKLIIITPPHMNGLLFQHLNKHVKELVVNTIQKDLHHLSSHDLLMFLKENTEYQDKK